MDGNSNLGSWNSDWSFIWGVGSSPAWRVPFPGSLVTGIADVQGSDLPSFQGSRLSSFQGFFQACQDGFNIQSEEVPIFINFFNAQEGASWGTWELSPCVFCPELSPLVLGTSGQVSSNGIQRTLTFFPGVEHGAVRVEGEPDADLGFKPATQRYHILHLGWFQNEKHGDFRLQTENTWEMS